jgi:hypothetical protein
MAHKTIIFVISLLLCNLYLANVSAAKFYKWTDEDGSIHYGDNAPDEVDSAEPVHISGQKTSKTVHNIPKFTVEDEQELTSEQQEKNKERETQLKDYCNGISKNIKQLQIGGRIQTIDDEGNRKFLNDEEQQQKLKKYQDQLSEKCSKS